MEEVKLLPELNLVVILGYMDNNKIEKMIVSFIEADCQYFIERGGGFYPHSIGEHLDAPLTEEQVEHIKLNLPILMEPFILPCSSMEEFYFLHDDDGYIELEFPSVKEECIDLIENFLLAAGISSTIVEELQWELVDEDGKRVY